MNTIPADIMKAAQECLSAIRQRERHDHEYLITRALMAVAKKADEAATKRERERCTQVVTSAGRQFLDYADASEAKGDVHGQFAAVSAGVGIERALRAIKGEA